jgi:hypothetical protein
MSIHQHTHSPAFLPANRMFLLQFETLLQEVLNDPDYAMPYWDSSIDAEDPVHSELLSSDFFGGNGNPARDNALTSGVFSDWVTVYPHPTVLTRHFDSQDGIGPFFNVEHIRYLLRNTNHYDRFRVLVETKASARVHLGIGGQMGSIDAFFNDPLSWLHRA